MNEEKEKDEELNEESLPLEEKDEEEIDDEGVVVNDELDVLVEYIREKDIKTIKSVIGGLKDVELLYIIGELSYKQKAIFFRLLHKDQALFVFEQLDTTIQKELLESFADSETIEFIEELDPDDRVQLLEELPASVAKKFIAMLSPEDRKMTNMLMGYDEETAGRIMTPEFISLRGKMTADEALQKVRQQAKDEDKETIYTLYVTDETKKLEGVVTLRKLLISDPSSLIEEIMTTTVVKVYTGTHQEEAAEALKEYDLLAIPVVDTEDKIVGIITIDDAVDILQHEATEDIYNQAGLANITSKETNRSEALVRGSIWAVWKVRLPFLFISLAGGLGLGFVMGFFEDILESIVMVAFFIPLIMDVGGSVGNQSTTIFVRGTALGQVDTKRFGKHLLREVGMGLSIGAVIGALAGIVATLWGHFASDMAILGLAVGLAITLTSTIAAIIGFLIPFLLVKLKLDQAAGAAPIITVLKDMSGILIYFLLVFIFMNTWITQEPYYPEYCEACYTCYNCLLALNP
ncbi:MAG: magnesium transporter [Firmicutes bacterium]|nr:magnesium transporter [Bacillota bacterium]